MHSHVNNLLAYSLTVIFEICFCKFQKENAFKNETKLNGHKKNETIFICILHEHVKTGDLQTSTFVKKV